MFLTLEELEVDNPHIGMTQAEARLLSEQIYDEYLNDYLRSQQGWRVIGGSGNLAQEGGLDEDAFQRESFVKRSRILARREPLSKQAVRLYSTYSGIQKISFKSENKKAEDTWKEKFWELDANWRIISPLFRKKLSNNLLTDGELFLTLFPNETSRELIVRTIDTLQIPVGNILTHPEDRDIPLFYKRQLPSVGKDGIATKNRVRYYRDWRLEDDVLQSAVDAGFEVPKDEDIARTANGDNVLVFHIPFDPHGLRGNGLLFAVLSYVENFRGFLQDRATIVKGLSTYIRKLIVKGGSKSTGDIAARLRSALAVGGEFENNPPDAVGSTWVENANLTKEETPPITNAGEALSDARVFRQPIASGTGLTEPNLTGDPSTGNLASQVQMEGPQLQNFIDYQQLWEEVFSQLWNFVMRLNNLDPSNIELSISFPPIIREPLANLATVLSTGLDKKMVPKDEAARLMLTALGSRDIEKLLKQLVKEREEGLKIAQQIGGGQQPPTDDSTDDPVDPFKTPVAGRKPESRGQPPNSRELPSRPREIAEHGVKIPGKCPMCNGEDNLIAAHDINYCESCQVTFNPSHFRVEAMAEKLQEILGISDEGWSGVEEAMFEGDTNGRV